MDKVRDFVSSLGHMVGNDYITNIDCLESLKTLELALSSEDILNPIIRNYIFFHQLVEKDLIPILIHSKDVQISIAVTKVLRYLTMPVEDLLPHLVNLVKPTPDVCSLVYHLESVLLTIVTAFLDGASTASVVITLRSEVLNSVKHEVELSDDNCNYVKQCLLLVRNIIHFPDERKWNPSSYGITEDILNEVQAVQRKLVWNLIVQGLGGALLLMLNTKQKNQWTLPLAEIITLLYKDQSIISVQQSLESVSSTSVSAEDDEESDGSKHSSLSLSSEPSKLASLITDSGCLALSDLGCHLSSDSCQITDFFLEESADNKISKDKNMCNGQFHSDSDSAFKEPYMDSDDEGIFVYSASSSSSESEIHALETKTQISNVEANSNDLSAKQSNLFYQADDNKKCNNLNKIDSGDVSSQKEVKYVKILPRTMKMTHSKHRISHSSKVPESDSSNENEQNFSTIPRTHTLVLWKEKNAKKCSICTASYCMEAALNRLKTRGRMVYPLWEKRNSIGILLDKNSDPPNPESLSFLLKSFTQGFLHSGFQNLILDLKDLSTDEIKSWNSLHFFWVLSYFLHFANAFCLNFRHINAILSMDIIGLTIYEAVVTCEEIEISISNNEAPPKSLLQMSGLLSTTLNELVSTIYAYSMKINNQKQKDFFQKLYCDLCESQEVRQLPLLLLQNYHSSYHTKQYLEDVIVFNHNLLLLLEKGSEYCWHPKRINLNSHLKQFVCQNIVNSYGRVLENYKDNSCLVNECIFTMFHHLAGDIREPQLLMQPLILRTFSCILKDDIDLEQYWEDVIMYILNKFSHHVERRKMKESHIYKRNFSEGNTTVDDYCSSSSSSTDDDDDNILLHEHAEDDELFWWYLQFEIDDDPISKISDHILVSKEDILKRLKMRNIISQEKYEEYERKFQKDSSNKGTIEEEEDGISEEIENDGNACSDEITQILRKLVQSGHHQHIIWLQDQLLETCYMRLNITSHVVEPVPYFSWNTKQNIPLVPYAEDQKAVLQDVNFIELLQKVGLLQGSDDGKLYPRIPCFWSAKTLYSVASHLGPINKGKLKFKSEEVLTLDRNKLYALQQNG